MELIWQYYIELSNARTSNGYSANPLSYSEIESWNKLTNSHVTPQEVKVIKRLDIVYLNHQAEKQRKKG